MTVICISLVVIVCVLGWFMAITLANPLTTKEKERIYREEMCSLCDNLYQPFFADTTRCDYCGEQFHTKCFTLHIEICPKLTKYREKEKELVDKSLL